MFNGKHLLPTHCLVKLGKLTGNQIVLFSHPGIWDPIYDITEENLLISAEFTDSTQSIPAQSKVSGPNITPAGAKLSLLVTHTNTLQKCSRDLSDLFHALSYQVFLVVLPTAHWWMVPMYITAPAVFVQVAALDFLFVQPSGEANPHLLSVEGHWESREEGF